jgi:uncharacterized membrane protein
MPVLLALACVILTAFVYSQLPVELGLRFQSDGTPLNLLSKKLFVALMIGLQFGAVITALSITVIFLKFATVMARNSQVPVNLAGFIFLMSNMLLLPQMILGYLMLDSYLFGLRGIHSIPLSIFSLWVVGIGTILIFYMFGKLLVQLRTTNRK